MAKEVVEVNGEDYFVQGKGSCTTEISKDEHPTDRQGDTRVVFDSQITKK
jgi:hypothetical protein